jgi:Calx-beta domain
VQATVVIMDSTEPGRIGFRDTTTEAVATAATALVPVTRKHGCDGKVSVRYRTQDADAIAGECSMLLM